MTKFEFFVLVIIGLILATTAEITWNDSGRYVKYDCKLVNTSPDIPENVKRMCRSKK